MKVKIADLHSVYPPSAVSGHRAAFHFLYSVSLRLCLGKDDRRAGRGEVNPRGGIAELPKSAVAPAFEGVVVEGRADKIPAHTDGSWVPSSTEVDGGGSR